MAGSEDRRRGSRSPAFRPGALPRARSGGDAQVQGTAGRRLTRQEREPARGAGRSLLVAADKPRIPVQSLRVSPWPASNLATFVAEVARIRISGACRILAHSATNRAI